MNCKCHCHVENQEVNCRCLKNCEHCYKSSSLSDDYYKGFEHGKTVGFREGEESMKEKFKALFDLYCD